MSQHPHFKPSILSRNELPVTGSIQEVPLNTRVCDLWLPIQAFIFIGFELEGSPRAWQVMESRAVPAAQLQGVIPA